MTITYLQDVMETADRLVQLRDIHRRTLESYREDYDMLLTRMNNAAEEMACTSLLLRMENMEYDWGGFPVMFECRDILYEEAEHVVVRPKESFSLVAHMEGEAGATLTVSTRPMYFGTNDNTFTTSEAEAVSHSHQYGDCRVFFICDEEDLNLAKERLTQTNMKALKEQYAHVLPSL